MGRISVVWEPETRAIVLDCRAQFRAGEQQEAVAS